MYFEHDGQSGLRYDPNCMVPANKAAREVDEFLRPRCFQIDGNRIEWQPNRVAVIPNWSYLHARGLSGHNDLDRVIERIYIY
jgi:alpha-ketoglutarate-dependent taurine dioxygenase